MFDMNFPLLIIFYFVLGDLAISLIKGPLEALLGIAYGIIGGILLWYIPAKGVSVYISLTSLQLLSIIFYAPATKSRGGILIYPCPSIRPFVRLSIQI